MANKSKQYPIPKFNNLDEEDKFWQSHSPLVEGAEGKVQKKKQNRASFLSIRLTGEELSKLREQAIQYGLGPSTYARQVLIQAMESGVSYMPPDLLFHMYGMLGKISDEQKGEYYQQLNKLYNAYREMQDEFARNIITLCVPNLLTQIEKSERLYEKESNRT